VDALDALEKPFAPFYRERFALDRPEISIANVETTRHEAAGR
jgi:hypothetical protein